MKKVLFVAALTLAANSHATVFGNTTNNNQTYNQPASHATANGGKGVGVGVGIASVGDIRNTNTANGGAGGSAAQGQSQSTDNSNSVNIEGDNYKRNPVATAYAAPLTATNGTCFGSASVGAQGVGFGFSFGSTKFDEECDRRYDSQELRALGMRGAALARMCQKASNAEAMKAAGTPCPGSGQDVSSISKNNAANTTDSNERYTDPIIRKRLGLAPL